MSTVTRAWTRRSAPERRRSDVTVTSLRRLSLPLRLTGLPAVSASLLDLDRPEANAIRSVRVALRHLEALALAARPEPDVNRVHPGRGCHVRHVRVVVV